MPDAAHGNLDSAYRTTDLDQALGDLQQAVGDRAQRKIDTEQRQLDIDVRDQAKRLHVPVEQQHEPRQTAARCELTRLAELQDGLDEEQRARDAQQRLLDDEQAARFIPYLTLAEIPSRAEPRRAEQLIARTAALDVRAQDAVRRAAEVRCRPREGPERNNPGR